jgi:squalene-associated FAD-dependent desaturase
VPRRIAVVGGGWSGLAAAVEATRLGHAVTLFEMAAQLGGRARRVDAGGLTLDNGQHILIGAYVQTLTLMRDVGVDTGKALLRLPLALLDARGNGLALRGKRPLPALLRAVLAHRGWRLRDRLALLSAATGWATGGFRCAEHLDVARWSAALPLAVRRDLIEPLAVAALNTPVREASASVFLRVLRDVLLGAPGAADLLLPRTPLSELLPAPAERWLRAAGADVRSAQRVRQIDASGPTVDGEHFDAVIVATSPTEAARLAAPIAPGWADRAAALQHQPIATVYLRGETAPWPAPMLSLRSGDGHAPAQFAFDLEALGREPGVYAFVVSGAAQWVERGVSALEAAAIEQASEQSPGRWRLLRTLVDRRATFVCTPGLLRPGASIAPTVAAAGDYVDGPYPGTLEGAVRSGVAAANAMSSSSGRFRDAK